MMLATDLLERRNARTLGWAGAALFVVAAHVGFAALALWHWPDDDVDDAAASPIVVEMAPVLPATPIDSDDAVHGPVTQEAKPTPQAAKETKEEVEKEMLIAPPSPVPDPEVVLPRPHPVTDKKPDEETPKEEMEKRNAEKAAAEQVRMAPPRVEAKQAVAAAPNLGSAAAARAKAAWERSLVSHLSRLKRYPDKARARGSEGEVAVEFTLDRTGGVIASHVVRSSGSQVLDDEALALLQRASPLPAPPGLVTGTTLSLTLPIQFHIIR